MEFRNKIKNKEILFLFSIFEIDALDLDMDRAYLVNYLSFLLSIDVSFYLFFVLLNENEQRAGPLRMITFLSYFAFATHFWLSHHTIFFRNLSQLFLWNMGKLAIFFRNICFVDKTEFFHLEIRIWGGFLGHSSKRGNCFEFDEISRNNIFFFICVLFLGYIFFVFFQNSRTNRWLTNKKQGIDS